MAGKREEQLKEISERLEQGVQELFTSERYMEYLKTMAKFHNYSFNNTMLIAMQKPDATLVAGYEAWKQKFERHVKFGEKGIKILAPVPVKQKELVEKVDPVTMEPVLKPDGLPELEEVERILPRFRVTTVFDLSQTEGKPLPDLGTGDLTAGVENYEQFMEVLHRVSPVPIRFEKMDGETHGYYHNADKEIVVKDGMSESQTMKTVIHEISHAMLHDREVMEEQGVAKDKMTKEVEAESIAFMVCSSFGLDSSDYSFPYIAGWSSGREMKELRMSMDTIRKTAGELIDSISEELRELQMSQEVAAEQEIGGQPGETLLWESRTDCYGIYQINEDSPSRDNMFMNLAYLQKENIPVQAGDYNLVYSENLDTGVSLEDLFVKFNQDRPDDFTGHSMSVSDVVVLRQSGSTKAYFVDSFGFSELPDFARQRQELYEKDKMSDMRRDNYMVKENTTGMTVEQHEGTWHTAETREINGQMFYRMEHDELGSAAASVIVDAEGKLVAQELENGFDGGAYEAVREYFAEKGIAWREETGKTSEQKIYPPVYPHTVLYAMEHGEVDTYLDSRKLNISCKKAVENAISNHFDGAYLSREAVDEVLDEYGKDRLLFVLAVTVQHLKSDGRFYRAIKEWAESVPIPENISRGIDLNLDYVVESHPAVLNGYIGIVREKAVELEKAEQQKEAKPFISRYYVVNDAYGINAEREYQYFTNLDAALTAYAMIPNHLEKELGMESTEQPPSLMRLLKCRNGLETLEDIELASLSGKWVTDESQEALRMAEKYLKSHETEIAFHLEKASRYFFIQTTSEGYDYTFYDSHFHELDGGAYDNPDVSITEAMEDILGEEGFAVADCKVMNVEELQEKTEQAEQEKTKQSLTAEAVTNIKGKSHDYDAGARETIYEFDCMVDGLPAVLTYSTGQREYFYSPLNDRGEMETVYSIHTTGEDIWDRMPQTELEKLERTLAGEAELFLMEEQIAKADTIYDLKEVNYSMMEMEHTAMTGDQQEKVWSGISDRGTAIMQTAIDSAGSREELESAQQTLKEAESLFYDDQYASLQETVAEKSREFTLVQEQQSDIRQHTNEKPAEALSEPTLSYYTAECSDFHVLGQFTEGLTLKEAVECYNRIEPERIHGIPSIGFHLEDGSIFDGDNDMFCGGEVLWDDVNAISHYRESNLIQKSLQELQEMVNRGEVRGAKTNVHEEKVTMADNRQEEKRNEQLEEQRKEQPQVAMQEESPKATESAAQKPSARKESVIQALRERQAKIKAKNKEQGKVQSHKKGDMEL